LPPGAPDGGPPASDGEDIPGILNSNDQRINERGRGKYYDIGYRLRNVCRIIVRSFGGNCIQLVGTDASSVLLTTSNARWKRAYQHES
jgi:hypothetical protein